LAVALTICEHHRLQLNKLIKTIKRIRTQRFMCSQNYKKIQTFYCTDLSLVSMRKQQ